MKKMLIALVDDHCLFRQGVAALIRTFPEYQVLFEAGSGEECCQKINQNYIPDIVLLDINMPVLNGLHTSEWLQKHHPEIRVIVVSMFDDEDTVIAMIKTGVRGYLLKDSDPSEFKLALDMVSANDVYFPGFVTRYLARSFFNTSANIRLNARELEFLRLVSTELTYKEIADQMFVSLRTVDGYRDQLFIKLNVKNRIGLVLYAIRNKIVVL
jgi:DNA-binding NarL/FixJ family response regulator